MLSKIGDPEAFKGSDARAFSGEEGSLGLRLREGFLAFRFADMCLILRQAQDDGLFKGVRIFALLLVLCLVVLPGRAQVPDPGTVQNDPAVQQDAEAAREKLLKAADQLDMIQSNAETTKSAVDAMKLEVTQLQADNAALKQQLADLQAAFDKSEAARAKERQVLLDEVADLIKSSKGAAPVKHHHTDDTVADDTTTEVHHPAPDSVPAPTSGGGGEADSTGPVTTPGALEPPVDSSQPTPPPPQPRKGYYHVVESGETLSMICAAYRDEGVPVTVAQVKKANGLTSKSVLKVGQKLFIPKPGT
jgi:LysM repeat protein